MKWKSVTALAGFVLTTFLITSSTAWGFGIDVRPDRWDNQRWDNQRWDSASDHRRAESRRAQRRSHAWDDDVPAVEQAGPFDRDFAWNRGWPSRNSGHDWWREFLLNDCISDSNLADWFAFKKKLWTLLLEHLHEHFDHPPQTVPLPAPLLLFGSGLIGLAGVLRRNKRVSTGR